MTMPRPRAPTITIDTSEVNPTGLNTLWPPDNPATTREELRQHSKEFHKLREEVRKSREKVRKSEEDLREIREELRGFREDIRNWVGIDNTIILADAQLGKLLGDVAKREVRLQSDLQSHDILKSQLYRFGSNVRDRAISSIGAAGTHIGSMGGHPDAGSSFNDLQIPPKVTQAEVEDTHEVSAAGSPDFQRRYVYALRRQALLASSHTTIADGISAKKMFEIPGHISDQISFKEHRIAAMGDTAAKYNFMKEDYAIQKGFAVRREHGRRVAITRDHGVTTTGTVEINFRFRGEKERHSLTFHLLPECIDDVILGKRFLKLTETFSVLKNFTRRVKKHVHDGLSKLHLFFLGDSAPKFTGLLNGRPREALADSGSNALIMDEEFARKMGLPIRNDPSHRNTVYFADNTTARTCGMTYNVRWEFGLGGSDKEHLLDFHILKNAPADVILSDEFLFKTSAFSEYDCYLVDEDDEDEDADAYFYGIKIDKSYNNIPVSIPEQMSEDARRDAEDDRIDNLPAHEQDIARQQEAERRAAWDARHVADNSDGSSTQGSASSVSVQTNGLNNSPPATTALPVIAVSSVVPHPPPLSGLTRWRFKLKRKKKAQISLSP